MNITTMKTEELQKIVDDAPDSSAEYAELIDDELNQYQYTKKHHYCLSLDIKTEKCTTEKYTYEFWNKCQGWLGIESPKPTLKPHFIKLSDIRAELLARPKFKVGDRVVVRGIQDFAITDFDYKALHKIESFATLNGVRSVCLDSFPFQCYAPITIIARATAEEEAVGHRIDEPEKCGWCNGHGMLGNMLEAEVCHYCNGDKVCRVVDPTVYDAPTDSPRDDFNTISESHRSPNCKCHEFPFDAELEVPVTASQQQIGGDHYTKLAIQPMHYSMANKLNPAQHTIIKYVTRYPDKGGIQDLLKARHTIDLLIERLKGEQGE